MNLRFFLSGAFAFCIEICLFGGVFFALLPKPNKQYTFEDKTKMEFIQIDQILEKPKQKEEKKTTPPKKQEKKQSVAKKIPKKTQAVSSPKPSPTVGADVKKLFEKVDSSNPPIREERIEDERPSFSANTIKKQEYTYENNDSQIQEESSKIQNILESMWEKELEVSAPQMQDVADGEYDEWFAKIKSILYAKWTNTFYESVSIRVSVVIKTDGSFDYRIIEYSKNQSYNTYMKEMLEELKNETFPPYPKGKMMRLEVIFKTKEHDNA